MIVIDGETNEKVARIPVGPWTSALTYNSINNKVYCANYHSDNVSVIDGENNRVIATIPVGDYPLAFCWNPIQNRTYVANFYGSSISVIRDVTGIEEGEIVSLSARNNFIVYPNPASSVVRIQSPSSVKEIKIYDVAGKLIRVEEFKGSGVSEFRISLKGIKEGVYYIRIGKETEKLIVKR